jgi:hypothetical protein
MDTSSGDTGLDNDGEIRRDMGRDAEIAAEMLKWVQSLPMAPWAVLLRKAAERLNDRPQGTEARVCEDIASRQRLGIAKYGVTVEQSDEKFKAWLQHAYEEALDMAVYLKRAIETYSC